MFPRPLLDTRFAATRALIVDLDGTLVDTLGDFVVALNGMLDDLGLAHIDRAFVERTVGKGSEHLIHQTLLQAASKQAPAAELFDTALARYQHHYQTVNGEHSAVFPGVVEGLQALQARGLPMACLTNKPTAFAAQLLQRKRLSGYFRHTFGGDAFARKKPDPLPLLKTCEALGTEPGATLMIGDSSNDAEAARRAGCPVVLVSYGYNHGEPVRSAPADAFVDRLDELLRA
ncbi:phosphoglycolate phosphatase [Caldimonas brevitalea]|uniref:Phosphoglycolate phosphatase n=1 Tax=Caldimonas brevitalea TaxID=413882 RepID=A0A0G3BYM9_9BURK|nr:phosphoglycolate phosphatase [Caldimonas brevitalea]AKJ31635.1 phosphoglycolate phosphatase [Caldimonas brevitalea]